MLLLEHGAGNMHLPVRQPIGIAVMVMLCDYLGTMASIHILARAVPATEESVNPVRCRNQLQKPVAEQDATDRELLVI